MKVEYGPELRANAVMLPVVQQRQGDIERVIGAAHPTAVATWEVRDTYRPRGLVLVVRDDDRQAEEPFTSLQLEGNGAFTGRLERMKESLVHHGRWKAAVHELMANVRDWSRALPGATVSDYVVTLNEERTGRYEVPAVEVRSGLGSMRVEPVAGWTMTPSGVEKDPKRPGQRALGRVDLRGPGGPIPLYYLVPGGDWIYQGRVLFPNDNPMLHYHLNRDDFVKLAQVCLDA